MSSNVIPTSRRAVLAGTVGALAPPVPAVASQPIADPIFAAIADERAAEREWQPVRQAYLDAADIFLDKIRNGEIIQNSPTYFAERDRLNLDWIEQESNRLGGLHMDADRMAFATVPTTLQGMGAMLEKLISELENFASAEETVEQGVRSLHASVTAMLAAR